MAPSAKVRALREAIGWSQIHLAERAKLSKSTVQEIDGGDIARIRRPGTLALLAEALGCPLDWLRDDRRGLVDLSPGDLRRLGERHGSEMLTRLAELIAAERESRRLARERPDDQKGRPLNAMVLERVAQALAHQERRFRETAEEQAKDIEELAESVLSVLEENLSTAERAERLRVLWPRFDRAQEKHGG